MRHSSNGKQKRLLSLYFHRRTGLPTRRWPCSMYCAFKNSPEQRKLSGFSIVISVGLILQLIYRNEYEESVKKNANAPLLTVSETVSSSSYGSFYQSSIASTNSIEAAMSNGLDTVILLQRTVRDLETKLGVTERWNSDMEEWRRAMRSKAEEDYDKAIDMLEVQVVSRLFELSKMNQARTGKFLHYHLHYITLTMTTQATRCAII